MALKVDQIVARSTFLSKYELNVRCMKYEDENLMCKPKYNDDFAFACYQRSIRMLRLSNWVLGRLEGPEASLATARYKSPFAHILQ